MTTSSIPLRISTVDGVRRIELVPIGAENTIGFAFTAALADATRDLSGVGCVLLTAEGRNFCLGGDLAAFAAADDPGAFIGALADDLHASLVRLDDSGVPVVVGAQGWAAGAGLSLLLTGDIILLEQGSRLRAAYGGVGLSPDGGLSWTLPRAVGRARAMDLVLTNRVMDADEALSAGLASRVVPDGTAAATAHELAAAIAAGPRATATASRTLLRTSGAAGFADHLVAERRSITERAGSAEGREGVAAFLARRPPRWPS